MTDIKLDLVTNVVFKNKQGGTWVVHGKGGGRKLLFSCSRCSKDRELYPTLFTARIYDLKHQIASCGCSGAYRWSEDQYKVKVKRFCEKYNLLFHGWKGKYSKGKTKLIVECLKHGKWEPHSLTSFLQCKSETRGCPLCANKKVSENNRTSDEVFIKRFIGTGNLSKDTVFWRSENLNKYGFQYKWKYKCTICSEDEYTKAGLCTGVFETTSYALKQGNLPCRCGKRYCLTEGQATYKVSQILKEKDYKFLGWRDGFTGIMSEVNYLCPTHGEVFSNFRDLRQGVQCNACSNEERKFDYYPFRLNEQDNLYILLFRDSTEKFIKIGRSFNVQRRLKDFPSNYTVKLLGIYTSSHKEVHTREKDIHRKLKHFKYSPLVKFGGCTECFSEESLVRGDCDELQDVEWILD